MDKRRKIITLTIFIILAIIIALIIPHFVKENRVVEVFIPKGSSPHKI